MWTGGVMGRVHRVYGVLVVAVFLGTGQYMDRIHAHLEGMPDGPRMLYRSAHIYLLYAGLLNLLLGAYFMPAAPGWRRGLQAVGSALLLIVPPLLLAAFFAEPALTDLERPWARPAIIMSLAGVACHALGHSGGSSRPAP